MVSVWGMGVRVMKTSLPCEHRSSGGGGAVRAGIGWSSGWDDLQQVKPGVITAMEVAARTGQAPEFRGMRSALMEEQYPLWGVKRSFLSW